MWSRIGLAIVRPQAALALAGNREHAGRSGSDLLVAIMVLVFATQLRGLLAALWLGQAVSWMLGGRALLQLLQGVLTIDLGALVIAAAVIFVASGRRREVGRSFDLACVTVLPIVLVQLVALVLAHATGTDIPALAAYGPGLAWTGALVALAAIEARRNVTGPGVGDVPRTAKLAGVAFLLVAAVGGWMQIFWIARHVDYVRPLTEGHHAPAFALNAIGEKGALGAPITLEQLQGKVVIVDFWATWCKPCLASLPHLDALARAHPDMTFLAVNMDDPAEARALFDAKHYTMTLVADDGDASERFGVSEIPHTVVIDVKGVVAAVARGEGDLERLISSASRP